MFQPVVSTAILRGYIGGISLFVHSGQFLYDSIVHTYVKGCTGKYAVAYTVVVYAYNTWYHVQCMYMYIHSMYMYMQCTYMSGACAELRLAGVARLIGPDGK